MESYQETTETVSARVQINRCVGDNFEILCLSYITFEYSSCNLVIDSIVIYTIASEKVESFPFYFMRREFLILFSIMTGFYSMIFFHL